MTDDPRDPAADTTDDTEFSDEHPLASPTELAGTTEHAIEAEFIARDAMAAQDEAANGESDVSSGRNTLPLDGE